MASQDQRAHLLVPPPIFFLLLCLLSSQKGEIYHPLSVMPYFPPEVVVGMKSQAGDVTMGYGKCSDCHKYLRKL